MTIFVVTRKTTGEFHHRYEAEAPVPWDGMGFGEFDHTPEPQPPAPVVETPGNRRLTQLEFRSLFTPAEKVRIELAQLDDPAAPMEQRAMSASLRAFEKDLAATTPDPDGKSVNRDDPRIVLAINTLAAAGLLDHGNRASEILNG